jgi:hypothetical protein
MFSIKEIIRWFRGQTDPQADQVTPSGPKEEVSEALPKLSRVLHSSQERENDQTSRLAAAPVGAHEAGGSLSPQIEGVEPSASSLKPDLLSTFYREILEHIHNGDRLYKPWIDLPSKEELEAISEPEVRLEMALKYAELSPFKTALEFERFRIDDEDARFLIAKKIANHDGQAASRFIANFELHSQDALIEVARIAVANGLSNLPRIFCTSNLPFDVIRRDVFLPIIQEMVWGQYDHTRLRGVAAQIQTLMEGTEGFIGISTMTGIEPAHWKTLRPKERLWALATWIKEQYPDFNDELLSYHHEVTTEAAAAAAFALTIGYWHRVSVDEPSNRARASLALHTGYTSIPLGALSSRTRSELWSVLLEAHELYGPQLSTLIPVDFSRTSDALRILTLSVALKGLRGELPHFDTEIRSKEQYAEAERALMERIYLGLQRQLGMAEDPQDFPKIHELLEKWGGGISPLFVLADRYAACEEWHAQKPVLTELARRCIDGSFLEWRYRTDDGQLDMFTGDQLSGWRENPAVLGEYTTERIDEKAEREALFYQVSELFSSGILEHIPQSIVAQMVQSPLSNESLSQFLQLEERQFAATVTPADAIQLIRYAIDSKDYLVLRNVIKLVNGAKARIFRELSKELRTQLFSDLGSMNNATKQLKSAEPHRYYVLSVVTDDPKLVLMTGDSRSDLDYDSGSEAAALLGNAIDGNIKLALSYAIKASVFESISLKRSDAQFRFDPCTQSLIVSHPEGQGIIPLEDAERVEILRVGSTKDHYDAQAEIISRSLPRQHAAKQVRTGTTTVCFTERDPRASHPIAKEIADQQYRLISEHLAQCGLQRPDKGETIHFPASRNPGGVLSWGHLRKGDTAILRGSYSFSA